VALAAVTLPILALLLGAEVMVPAGAPLAEALARLAPGDTLRLGSGEHLGALGRPVGVAVVGAGAGLTVVRVPQGEDGVVATGALALSGLTIVTGPRRTALKVLGGSVTLDDVALVGGAAGAFLDQGRLDGREVLLQGDYGLLAAGGQVRLTDLTASGRLAGVAVLGGTVELRRAAVTGPSSEAAVSVAGGSASLAEVFLRDPGPTGLSVLGGAVTARDLSVSGPQGDRGILGDCVQARRGTVRLASSELSRCGGAALEASRSEISLDGVDAVGGEAGCLIFTDQSHASLAATLCTRRGPGLVAMQGSTVTAFGARFWTDPAIWADCGSGARVELRGAPGVRQPCTTAAPPAGRHP
jgi:hypothetical protein